MKGFAPSACLTIPMLAPCAFADDAADLAKSRQCFTRHEIDTEMMAPSFRSIAAKYERVKNAGVMPADEIAKGGAARSRGR